MAKNFLSDVLVQQAEQQMFGADVIVLELVRLGLRGIERLLQVTPSVRIVAALNLVSAREFLFQIRLKFRGRHADAGQQFRHEAFGLAEQGEQQMLAVHLLMRMFPGDTLRTLQRLLRFLGQLVELHKYQRHIEISRN